MKESVFSTYPCKRDLYYNLLLKKTGVYVIEGLPYTGKTVLMKQLAESRNGFYVSAEETKNAYTLVMDNFNKYDTILIDEIQLIDKNSIYSLLSIIAKASTTKAIILSTSYMYDAMILKNRYNFPVYKLGFYTYFEYCNDIHVDGCENNLDSFLTFILDSKVPNPIDYLNHLKNYIVTSNLSNTLALDETHTDEVLAEILFKPVSDYLINGISDKRTCSIDGDIMKNILQFIGHTGIASTVGFLDNKNKYSAQEFVSMMPVLTSLDKEHLCKYLLSMYLTSAGYDVRVVDSDCLDIIAYEPHNDTDFSLSMAIMLKPNPSDNEIKESAYACHLNKIDMLFIIGDTNASGEVIVDESGKKDSSIILNKVTLFELVYVFSAILYNNYNWS